jgi:hypothetical protein
MVRTTGACLTRPAHATARTLTVARAAPARQRLPCPAAPTGRLIHARPRAPPPLDPANRDGQTPATAATLADRTGRQTPNHARRVLASR